jgi:gamma-glutamyltranspeptidase/glutathione hydrolase
VDAADTHTQPELGSLLEEISAHGAAAFYEGRAAELLANEMRSGDGIVDLAALAGYKPRRSEPHTIDYRGFKIAGTPWSILIYSQFLQTLAQFDLGRFKSPQDPARLHIIIEILRRCFHDRLKYGGDADFVDGPWKGLASLGYAQALARKFDARKCGLVQDGLDPYDFDGRATPAKAPQAVAGREGNTVHISAADANGGMASLTETVLGNYGSLVSTEAGVLLNNGMMAFAPVEGHPNSIAPGKRPSTNMGPMLIFDSDGRPIVTIGASGGRKIVGSILQIISHLIDHGMEMQRAVSEPRIDVMGDVVLVDSRMPPHVPKALSALGHEVVVREEGLATFEFGNPCGIQNKGGLFFSGVNPFQMTAAAGW